MSRPDILFVDDDQDILDLATSILHDSGYAVLPAVSGDVAAILIDQGLPFELLVTDVVMPGFLDGFALARKARQGLPEIRIIYATSFPAVADVRSRGAPYGEVLVKPWRPPELLQLVRALMPRHTVPAAPPQ